MKNKAAVLISMLMIISSPIVIKAFNSEVQIAFSINLLSPNNDSARNQWSLLIQEQLPKIGIGVTFHESTTWANIAPRSWSYPLIDYDYIPTYAEGGYDMLFIGRSWDLDWDPNGYYTTASMCSIRNNFYQYVNPIFDETLGKYLTTTNTTLRTQYSHELQAILYEDLPAICIVYPRSLFVFSEGISGVDILLLATSNHQSEKWDDYKDHIIKYIIPEKIEKPNIFVQELYYDAQWMQSIYGSLYRRSQGDHEWEPMIAKNTSYSAEGKNLTVTMDPEAVFSDGSPVLAEDVKYSYQLYMSPVFNPARYIKSQMYRTLNMWFASNDSIQIVDSHTLNFNLTSPYNFALSLLSYGIIDKSTVEPLIATHGYSIFNELPLTGNVQNALVKSCGPFMLNTYDSSNSTVLLRPNPHWYKFNVSGGYQPLIIELHVVHIPNVDNAIAGLIAGQYDIMDSHYNFHPPSIYIGNIEGVLVKDPKHEEIAINMKHPVMGTGELTPVGTAEAAKNIRKAISHAIPRQTIVDEILEGLGAPGVIPMPDSCIGFDQSLKPYKYDLDLAKDYIEKAGFGRPHTHNDTGLNTLFILSITSLVSVSYLRRKIKKLKKKIRSDFDVV